MVKKDEMISELPSVIGSINYSSMAKILPDWVVNTYTLGY